MSIPLESPRRAATETVDALRERLGLFSFRHEERGDAPSERRSSMPGLDLDLRPGVIVEWLVARPGSGAWTSMLGILSRSLEGRGAWAIVDPHGEIYVPALSGWGVDPRRALLLRPTTLQETCWAIEQCLRCPGVSVTWAYLENRLPATVLRRWKMAAEAGGGLGLLFRPDLARREPTWADLRLRVSPLSGGRGDSRRIRVDVLYRRGGLGGIAQVWEIDHAAGDVRLVPQVVHPTAAERSARA
jgi:hypothetical protein